METMKAAVLHDVRDLRVVDVPKPSAGRDGVLVRVRTVGVCGTDLHTYKRGLFKEMSLPQEDGVLFGHDLATQQGQCQQPELRLSENMAWMPIAPGRFAVFRHRGPPHTMYRSWQAIYREWLPGSGQGRSPMMSLRSSLKMTSLLRSVWATFSKASRWLTSKSRVRSKAPWIILRTSRSICEASSSE